MTTKMGSLFIGKRIFFTNHTSKFVYLNNPVITEASRKRLNHLLRENKVRAYVCSLNTIAFSRV